MSEPDKHPPVLRAMLLGAGDDSEAREVIIRSYYGGMEGAKHSVAVYQAVTLSAVYNAVRRDLGASIGQLAKHLQESEAEQGGLTRQALAAQFEAGRKDEQTEREKHLQLLRDHVEDLRRKSAALAETQARSWQNVVIRHGLTALLAFGFGFTVCFWWDTEHPIKPVQVPAPRARETAPAQSR